MAIYDIFSRRHKEPPDVFQYDDLPEAFRVQVAYIWREAIGDWDDDDAQKFWSQIVRILAKELGVFHLVDKRDLTPWAEWVTFFMTASTEDALSQIEMSFHFFPACVERYPYPFRETRQSAEDAISDLNERFKMHGIGYEFINDKIIRIDSQYLHAETVKPALLLLKTNKFKGAEEEFLQAHEHFRKGKHEDALTWALKSLESAMKTICEARKIPYDPKKDTAKQLIDKMFASEVIPAYMQTEFSGIRAVLESGSPTLRNKSGGHGAGAKPRDIPEHFAAYALHMAASNIVFLVESHLSR